ncbi:MAG: Ig-like domain-containing protein [Gemmatimonadetes bacterium]|nr:Ig-like domain-containing protein [Gemmatimonadota bacterium]
MSWFVRRALVSSACLATLSLGACGDDVSVVAPPPEPAITSVVVSPGGAAIRVGETLVMVAFVNADSGAVRTVRWSSADPRRASVTANGIVTGISEGIAVITATSTVRAEVQASATITVLPGPTVRQVAIVPATLSLRVGETSPLVPVVAADSGADRTVIWSSVDPSRVSVSSTGVITALAEGTAVITATSRARPDIAASAAVTVVPAAGVRSVAVTPQGLELLLGQQQALAVTVDADPGVARTVTYSTNDASIATVSGAGVVTGVGAGTATITVAATADPRVAATVVATVKPPTAPAVSIRSVTQGGTSLPVNLAGAAGQLDVSINVAAGTDPLQRLDLVISQNGRDSVVASQVYAASLAARTSLARTSLAPRLTSPGDSAHDLARHVAALRHAVALVTSPVVLSFRSNMYDAATGTVAFRNGPATIRAVARSVAGSAGAGPTATNSVAVTLDNRDGFHVSMRPLASTGIANATDANGLRWVQAGQGLEVTTIPVSYSARGVGSRILSYPGNAPVAHALLHQGGHCGRHDPPAQLLGAHRGAQLRGRRTAGNRRQRPERQPVAADGHTRHRRCRDPQPRTEARRRQRRAGAAHRQCAAAGWRDVHAVDRDGQQQQLGERGLRVLLGPDRHRGRPRRGAARCERRGHGGERPGDISRDRGGTHRHGGGPVGLRSFGDRLAPRLLGGGPLRRSPGQRPNRGAHRVRARAPAVDVWCRRVAADHAPAHDRAGRTGRRQQSGRLHHAPLGRFDAGLWRRSD